MTEKACGNCKHLKICAYARAILNATIKVDWALEPQPFSWYDIAKICKFYELNEEAV